MKPEIFKDNILNDDLIITNTEKLPPLKPGAPNGRLFQLLGKEGDRQVVKYIESNTVVVGGAIASLENLVGVNASWKPGTLNEIYNVAATPVGTPKVALFGVGTGGSNLEFGSVIAPDIKQRDVLSPVPMRYGSTISGTDANKYFMKVPAGDGANFSWYLKEFGAVPTIKSYWKNGLDANDDGTEITSEIWNSTSTEGITTFAEFQIDLSTLDVREYFESVGQISTARYNTIGFYTGSKNAESTEYGDVRLYSVITFNNRDLSIATSSVFLYRLYSLI